MKKILVVGSVNIDYTIYVDEFPRVGETLIGKNKIASLGGKGVNQAIASLNSGGDVTFLCFLGQDDIASQIKQQLKKYNVNSCIEEIAALSSGNAFIFVDSHSQNEIVVVSGANYVLDTTLLTKHEDLFKQAEYLILQNEIHPMMNRYIIEKYGHDHKIILNPAPALKLADNLLSSLYFITPNEGELALLTGKSNIDEGARFLLDKGVQNVVVTLGENGCVYYSKDRKLAAPAFKVNSIDTVAAGDTFLGCFVTSLAQGGTIEQALRFASAGAALSTTKSGAAPSIPNLKEIHSFLKNH